MGFNSGFKGLKETGMSFRQTVILEQTNSFFKEHTWITIFLQPGVIGGILDTTQFLEISTVRESDVVGRKDLTFSYNLLNFLPPDTYCVSLEGNA